MPAQYDIGAGFGPCGQRRVTATQQVSGFGIAFDVHGLVHHHHPQLFGPRLAQPRGHALHLFRVDFTFDVAPPARCLHALHQQPGALVHRLEFIAEGGAVAAVRRQQAQQRIQHREIVVAGDADERQRQTIDEAPGCRELRGPRALRDVARDHQQLGRELRCQRRQRFNDGWLLSAEVGV